jgi:hypothetical protein
LRLVSWKAIGSLTGDAGVEKYASSPSNSVKNLVRGPLAFAAPTNLSKGVIKALDIWERETFEELRRKRLGACLRATTSSGKDSATSEDAFGRDGPSEVL